MRYLPASKEYQASTCPKLYAIEMVIIKNSLQFICALGLEVRSVGPEKCVEGNWLCINRELVMKEGQGKNEREEQSKAGKEGREKEAGGKQRVRK